MAPQPPKYRRLSYVVPLPAENPPRLALPPHGAPRNGNIRPLLVPAPIPAATSRSPQSHFYCSNAKEHQRHRLGVSSLALDLSTQLAGKTSAEGILYSGGRDGQIIAWDLKLKTKKRAHRYGYRGRGSGWRTGRWEILTGWGDDMDEEEEMEDEVVGSDGDVLGDVVDSMGKKRRKSEALAETIPYEQTWELDADDGPIPPSGFRQCIQTHTDWINDIMLCNLNQTVVSASSDGTVRAWSPHLSTAAEPALVGIHDDYVRCLTASPHQNWIASGSFDRTIKLWDISRTMATPSPTGSVPVPAGSSTSMTTLSLPTPSQKSSVYALDTDQFGSVIASGSPERVIRMWDPRTGKRTGKLVGHTDIIRAVVLSADGRYLLTGSADASIKLWSLAAQRCLHTFAHHTDSVWALSSQHPSLEIFYSGDRSGIVCRVDMEGCNAVDEGECFVLCNATQPSEDEDAAQDAEVCVDGFRLQDGAGVNNIVALDDRLVWTATGSSCINRWKAPPSRTHRVGTGNMLASPDNTTFSFGPASASRRTSGSSDVHSPKRGISLSTDGTHRFSDELPLVAASPGTPRSGRNFSNSMSFSHPNEEDTTLFGLPYRSLVRLVSPNDPYTLGSPIPGGRRGMRRHTSRDTEIATLYSAASVKSIPMHVSRHSVPPLAHTPALRSSFRQNTGTSLGSRLMAIAPEIADENWTPTVRAQYEDRDLAATAVPLESFPDNIIEGDDGFVRATVLNDRMHVLTVNTAGYVGVWDIARCRCVGWFDRSDVLEEMGCGRGRGTDRSSDSEHGFRSPRDLLETVRERIEGESVIAPWATADTRVGNLTVHLSEKCFDTEIYADEAGYGHERLYDTEQRLNVAKWILSNLFEGFVREELIKLRRPSPLPSGISQNNSQRTVSQESRPVIGRKRSASTISYASLGSNHSRLGISPVVSSPSMTPAIVPDMSVMNVSRNSTSLSAPLIPITGVKDPHLSPIPQSPGLSVGSTPTPKPRREASDTSGMSRSAPGRDTDYFSAKTKRLSATSNPDDFSGWGGVGSKEKDSNPLPQTPSTPSSGGFIGRLRQLGKSSKRPLSGEVAGSSGGSLVSPASEGMHDHKDHKSMPEPETEQSRFLGSLVSQSFHPPSNADAPPLKLPPDTEIILAEETPSGWTNVYRGTVASTGADVASLEKLMPLWLMQYLLSNKIPLVPNIKVSFGVAPWPGQEDGSPPESAPTRLTANRHLRVRKVITYVQDKIERPISRSTSRSGSISGATPRSSSEAARAARSGSASSQSPSPHHADFEGKRPRPEDVYEVLCNDTVLPLNMTLASIRHYVWRSSGELLLFYRKKA